MNNQPTIAWVGRAGDNRIVVTNDDNVPPEPTGDGLTLANIIQEGFNQR